MKFSIITTTYKNTNALKKAVLSVQDQIYPNWEMIIINDSPKDDSYFEFSSTINDPRIHYHLNLRPFGKNYCLNLGIEKISADSRWIIFLNDTDSLAPDTLKVLHDLILIHPQEKWFVTNQAYKNGTPLTKFPNDDTTYNYAWRCLIVGRGEVATHCIDTKLIIHNSIRFSKYVQQGEEWFFFYQVGLNSKLYYYDHNSTITENTESSHYIKTSSNLLKERYEVFAQILFEGVRRRIVRTPFLIYITYRILKFFTTK